MASETTILNRSRSPIVVETGRVPPYQTTKVSSVWYKRRASGHRTVVPLDEYRDRVLTLHESNLKAECRRAGLEIDGTKREVQKRLLDAVGADYDAGDLAPEEVGGEAGEATEEAPDDLDALENSELWSLATDIKNDVDGPDIESRTTESLKEYIREHRPSES